MGNFLTLLGTGPRQSAPAPAGITPTDLGATLITWLKADADTFTDSARTTPASLDGDRVGGWTNEASGASVHAVQTSAGKRGALKLAIQNSLPVVRLSGSIEHMDLTGLSKTARDYTLFLAGGFSSHAAGDSNHLLDVATGRLAIGQQSNALGWYDGSWETVGTTANGFRIYTFLLKAGAASIRVNGSAVGAPAYTQQALGGTIYLGANISNDGTNNFPGDIGEFLLCDSALAAGDITGIEAYLNGRWAAY